MHIGILHQPKIPASAPLAVEIQAWLEKRGVQVWASSTWDEDHVNGQMDATDMLIVLGGDGSTLHAARLALPYTTPIFGVNLGHIGFLSESEPDNWAEKLEKVLQNEYWREQRLMLHAAVERDGQIKHTFFGLNDVVISRGTPVRLITMHLSIDGDYITTYRADGVIIATPTGSTAYSMAVGGPILPPQLQNFVVVPVAAHLSLDRALVLHEEAEISIQVEMDHEATITADGQGSAFLENGDKVIVKKHKNHSTFIRVEDQGYFYRRLLRRLGVSRTKIG